MSAGSVENKPGTNPHTTVAQNEASVAADKGKEAAQHAGASLSEASKSAGQTLRRSYQQSKQAVGDAAKSTHKAVVDGYEAGRGSFKSMGGQISAAYAAGKTGHVFTRELGKEPTGWQTFRSYPKALLTSPSYVAGHAISNPSHSIREDGFFRRLLSPSFLGKLAAAGAALWSVSLGLAGVSRHYLGFLAKPVPYTGGLVTLPNIGWRLGQASLGLLALSIAVRVGFALYAKIQESRAYSKLASTDEAVQGQVPSDTTTVSLSKAELEGAIVKKHPLHDKAITTDVVVGTETVTKETEEQKLVNVNKTESEEVPVVESQVVTATTSTEPTVASTQEVATETAPETSGETAPDASTSVDAPVEQAQAA